MFFNTSTGTAYVGCFYYGNPVAISSSDTGGASSVHPEFTNASEHIECDDCDDGNGGNGFTDNQHMPAYYYLTGPDNTANYTATNPTGAGKAPSGQEVLTHFTCTYASPALFGTNGGNVTSPNNYNGADAKPITTSTLASVSGNIFNTNHNSNGKGYNGYQNWAPYILQNPDDQHNTIPHDGCSKIVGIDGNGNIDVDKSSDGGNPQLGYLYNCACFNTASFTAKGSLPSTSTTFTSSVIPPEENVIQIRDLSSSDPGINTWNIFNLNNTITTSPASNATGGAIVGILTLTGLPALFNPASPALAKSSVSLSSVSPSI
jgi:hypothetical protein